MDCTEVFELINPSDHITFVATRSDAEVMATILKESWMFVQNINGDTIGVLEDGDFKSRHDAIYRSSENLERYAKGYESAWCATASERETINDAVARMPSPSDRKQFVDKWQDCKRTSMNDICGQLHRIAESLRTKALELAADLTP